MVKINLVRAVGKRKGNIYIYIYIYQEHKIFYLKGNPHPQNVFYIQHKLVHFALFIQQLWKGYLGNLMKKLKI